MMGNRMFGKGVVKVKFSLLPALSTNLMTVPSDI